MVFAGLSFAGIEECGIGYELKDGKCAAIPQIQAPELPTPEPKASWVKMGVDGLMAYPELTSFMSVVLVIIGHVGYVYRARHR